MARLLGSGSSGNTATPTLYVVVMFRDDAGILRLGRRCDFDFALIP